MCASPDTPDSHARLGPVSRLISAGLIGMTRLYQFTLSPVLTLLVGPVCRFEPTCSHYMIQAIQKHGPWRGLLKGLRRLSRCHPWGGHGYDPP